MVKVAIAAASSQLAREIIDALVATNQHEILALGRKEPSSYPSIPGVQWVKTSYEEKEELVAVLKGTHTLLSFVDVTQDSTGSGQKRLLDAAIEAGVQRFAPSEWSMGEKLSDSLEVFPWYAGKLAMREYLRELNEEEKVIEYTLFQPGLFMDYLAYPTQVASHVSVMPGPAMLQEGRILVLEGHLDDPITFTATQDIARVVAAAVSFDREWPVIGGISGDTLSLRDVQTIGESITGHPYRVDVLRANNLDENLLNLEDMPLVGHHSIPEESKKDFALEGLRGLLLAFRAGGWTCTDDWNKLLPDLKLTSVKELAQQLPIGNAQV